MKTRLPARAPRAARSVRRRKELIRDGKAEVQVWLTDKSDESMAQLKELGFEVLLNAKSANMIVGRLPIEKLEALAKFKFVKYVAPQR